MALTHPAHPVDPKPGGPFPQVGTQRRDRKAVKGTGGPI